MRRAKEAQKRRQQAAVDRVDEVTARIDGSSAPDARDLEDRVTAVYAGYNETTAITDRAQKLSAPPESDAKRISRPQVAARTTWKAAKSTASGVGQAVEGCGESVPQQSRTEDHLGLGPPQSIPRTLHRCTTANAPVPAAASARSRRGRCSEHRPVPDQPEPGMSNLTPVQTTTDICAADFENRHPTRWTRIPPARVWRFARLLAFCVCFVCCVYFI